MSQRCQPASPQDRTAELVPGSSEPASVRARGVWRVPSRLQLALARGGRAWSAADVAFWILIIGIGLCTCARLIGPDAVAPASVSNGTP
jgi:hypothetical protein